MIFHKKRLIIYLISIFILIPPLSVSAGPLDRDDVNPFDRPVMFPYSKRFDIASDIAQYTAFLMPAVFLAAAPENEYTEIGLMYTTSALLSFGIRTGLKAAIDRDRPYMYFDNPNKSAVEDGESDDSFPSGHTIMAFTGASYTVTLFALRYPDSVYRFPASAAAVSFAAGTALFRVLSGSHFISDVLAGAMIGSFSGFIVPWISWQSGLLEKRGSDMPELYVSPAGINVRLKF